MWEGLKARECGVRLALREIWFVLGLRNVANPPVVFRGGIPEGKVGHLASPECEAINHASWVVHSH